MELHREHNQETRTTTFTLVISEKELDEAMFQNFDLHLFDEITADEEATISDNLLALELVARRIEEGHG